MGAEYLCDKYVEIRIKSSKACEEKGGTTSQLLKTSVVEERQISSRLIDNEVSSSTSYRMWQSETCTASKLRTLNLKPVANSK